MINSKIIFSFITFFLLQASPERNQVQIEEADWLLGTWVATSAKGNVYEQWEKSGPYEFSGKSFALKEKDTVVIETIRLVREGGELFYIPLVYDQNEGKPIRFQSVSVSEKKLVFQNLIHGFPQQISYELITPDSMVAEISGVKDGTDQKRVFPMKRMTP